MWYSAAPTRCQKPFLMSMGVPGRIDQERHNGVFLLTVHPTSPDLDSFCLLHRQNRGVRRLKTPYALNGRLEGWVLSKFSRTGSGSHRL